MTDETETVVAAPAEAANEIEFDDLSQQMDAQSEAGPSDDETEANAHTAGELEAVFDVPVKVKAILGRTKMEVSELLKISEGTVIELDRKVGEAIDIFVNNRLVARGEVVLVEDRLGITMTEMIKLNRN
ncbi:MAG: flagellar motor switch protein FliN [Rhizobiales bacterium]|nr:flagellar motor switch protein FliN [Hyphomicrobiales bacterium]